MRAASPLAIWAMLVAVTGVSWLLAEGPFVSRIAASAVILVAAFKINLVVGHFMELDWQPRPFRIIVTVWLMAVTIIIIAGQWAA